MRVNKTSDAFINRLPADYSIKPSLSELLSRLQNYVNASSEFQGRVPLPRDNPPTFVIDMAAGESGSQLYANVPLDTQNNLHRLIGNVRPNGSIDPKHPNGNFLFRSNGNKACALPHSTINASQAAPLVKDFFLTNYPGTIVRRSDKNSVDDGVFTMGNYVVVRVKSEPPDSVVKHLKSELGPRASGLCIRIIRAGPKDRFITHLNIR